MSVASSSVYAGCNHPVWYLTTHNTAPAMSRIFGSLFLTAILFRDAFLHHKPLSYLLLLGVFLFLCFIYDIIRAIFDWLR